MASYYLTLAAIALSILACNCRADLINDVCSKSRNAALCNTTLRSDRRSKGASLGEIATITIEKSLAAVGATFVEAKRAENPKLRASIAACIIGLNRARGTLNEITELLKEIVPDPSIKQTLKIKADGAIDRTSACLFGSNEPVRLEQATKNAVDLISVLVAVSIILSSSEK